jgi:hypothetical protein
VAKVTPKTTIEKLICAKDWDCKTALAIAKAESGLRCEAVGDGHIAFMKNGTEYGKSYGVFQIRHLEGRPNPEELLSCEFNINYAYNLYKAQGFKPWSAYKNLAYKRHLK